MEIKKDTVVSFHYRLKNEAGEEIENSYDSEAVAYLHGHGNIIGGLEHALEGKSGGENVSVTLSPKEAYGERVENAVQRVPIKHLYNAGKTKLKPGQVVAINTENGPKQATVIKAGKFNVDVDLNHPLAGQTLTFEVGIQSIRQATEEELSHGHAHGPGGHQH